MFFSLTDMLPSTEGLIMGNPLSPILAEISMDFIEQKIHENKLCTNCIYWYRYVDDIIVFYTGTNRQLNNFLQYISSIYPNINFTLKYEDNSINFLDLTITKINVTRFCYLP